MSLPIIIAQQHGHAMRLYQVTTATLLKKKLSQVRASKASVVQTLLKTIFLCSAIFFNQTKFKNYQQLFISAVDSESFKAYLYVECGKIGSDESLEIIKMWYPRRNGMLTAETVELLIFIQIFLRK